jgi:hypothetical protein
LIESFGNDFDVFHHHRTKRPAARIYAFNGQLYGPRHKRIAHLLFRLKKRTCQYMLSPRPPVRDGWLEEERIVTGPEEGRAPLVGEDNAQSLGEKRKAAQRALGEGEGGAGAGVGGLDNGVDEVAPLVVRKKGALHGVDGELLEIVNGEAEGIRGGFELPGHRGITHEAVIGVEGDAEFLLVENPERMLFEAAGRAGVDVADEANLEGGALVENILGDVAKFDGFAVDDGNVIDESGAVANAVRAAVLDGLPNRLFAESFASVNGDIEILALNVVEGVDVLLGGKPPSSPARLKPTTPRWRKSTASSAISSDTSILRMAQISKPEEMPKS